MKATLINADGTETTVTPSGKKFSLQELQDHVGGYIEVVYLSGGRLMVVDEEGLMKSKEPNRVASIMAQRTIVGNVLVGIGIVS